MTFDDLAILRHYIDEPTDTIYGDVFLNDVIGRTSDLYGAAAEIWTMKAARFAKLVDVTESGSSRRMSQRTDAARQQATYYAALSGQATAAATGQTHTRPIVRPTGARS